jgi:AcrR family transcriptional regulator
METAMSAQKLGTEIRQEQIAQAALGLVADQGLKKLSVAGVARRVGLVPSAIYRHYKSKDDVIDAVLDHIGTRLIGFAEIVCHETEDPLERIKGLLFRHVELIRKNQAIPRIVFSDEIYIGHPERKAKMYKTISAYLSRVEDIIAQGQKEGSFLPDRDPKTLSVMFLGLIQPAGILWHMSEGRFDVTKHMERAWRIFSEFVLLNIDG